MIENSLKPLKEYYLSNPHQFNTSDASLMDKALKLTERTIKFNKSHERERESNEILKRIFVEVKD